MDNGNVARVASPMTVVLPNGITAAMGIGIALLVEPNSGFKKLNSNSFLSIPGHSCQMLESDELGDISLTQTGW